MGTFRWVAKINEDVIGTASKKAGGGKYTYLLRTYVGVVFAVFGRHISAGENRSSSGRGHLSACSKRV